MKKYSDPDLRVFQLSEKRTPTVALLKKQERAQTSASGVSIDLVAELFRLTASISFVISDLLTRLWFFCWLTCLGRRSLPAAIRIYAQRVLWHSSCFYNSQQKNPLSRSEAHDFAQIGRLSTSVLLFARLQQEVDHGKRERYFDR
jgi:hypothetical protein